MAALSPTGGANRTVVFGYSAGALAALTGITAGYMLFNKNETSPIVGDVRIDQVELELGNKKRDVDWIAFKDAVLTRVNIVSNVQPYEDGTEDNIVNIPTTAIKLNVIHVDGELSGSRIVTCFVGLMASEGTGTTRSSGTLGDTNVKFVAIPAPQATTLTAASIYAALSDALATGFTDIVIASGSYGKEVLLSAA